MSVKILATTLVVSIVWLVSSAVWFQLHSMMPTGERMLIVFGPASVIVVVAALFMIWSDR